MVPGQSLSPQALCLAPVFLTTGTASSSWIPFQRSGWVKVGQLLLRSLLQTSPGAREGGKAPWPSSPGRHRCGELSPAPSLPHRPPLRAPPASSRKKSAVKKGQDGGWGEITHGSDGSCPPSIACRQPKAEQQLPTGRLSGLSEGREAGNPSPGYPVPPSPNWEHRRAPKDAHTRF